MKNKKLNIILTICGLVVLVCYLTWSVFILRDNRGNQPCGQVRVYLTDSTSRQFLRTNEVVAMLKQNKLYPTANLTIDKLDATSIENLVASHNLLKSAQCYTTPNGDVILSLKQKQPKFRVIGQYGDYFVDTERSPMNVTVRTASYVPVVTGEITQEKATGEMFDFVDYIEHDAFWNSQIEQIVVVGNKTIKLIPRIGSHTIILGTLENYEKKLDKLETLYVEGFTKKTGWKNYKEIDLRYEGQIVCR